MSTTPQLMPSPNPGAARTPSPRVTKKGEVKPVTPTPRPTPSPSPGPSPKPKYQPKPGPNNGDYKYEIPASYTAADVKFNLPPHKWSLPVNQNLLNSSNMNKESVPHSTRRAKMWCFGPVELAPMSSTVAASKSSGTTTEQKWLIEQVGGSQSKKLSSFDTAWGFQFLWNPEKLNNALSRNSNFTPSAADRTAQFYSLFTAMEAMNFNITIDRVNDFAAIKGLINQYPLSGESAYMSAKNTFLQYAVDNYYSGNGYPSSPKNPENPVDQLKTLMKLGTLADIEYIYKMINGEGLNGEVRRNALGRKTADIGFLSPTPIAVQFGPSVDSLSYVGWIDGLSVTHTMFTEDMIPIHSEVSVNFVAFARTTLG